MGNKFDCREARRHSKQDVKTVLMQWEEDSDSYTNDSLPDGITFQSY